MRTPNRGSVQYAPGIAPTDPDALPRYINEQLAQVAAAIQLLALGHIDPTNVAPTNPRDGDIRYASTGWNPGAGVGIYYYKAGTWTLLG